jgi:hypothetical protein
MRADASGHAPWGALEPISAVFCAHLMPANVYNKGSVRQDATGVLQFSDVETAEDSMRENTLKTI